MACLVVSMLVVTKRWRLLTKMRMGRYGQGGRRKRKVNSVQRVDEESKNGENNDVETKDKNDDTDVLFAPGGDESMPPPPSENNFLRKDDEAGKFVKRGKTPATEEEDNNLPDNEDDPFGAQFQANGGDQASPPMERGQEEQAKVRWQGTKNFNTTATFGGGNENYSVNDSSELVKEINRLKAALDSRKENEGRVVELLSQNSQLKIELHATKTNLEAAKAAVSAPSKSEEFIFRARRAAIRPILKKWRAAKLSVGFAAFESNCNEQANKEGKEAFVKKRRAHGAQLMYKTLQRALHARICTVVEHVGTEVSENQA